MGKFSPGISPNPNGRPKGIKDSRAEMRDLFAEAGPDLVQKVIDKANEGDKEMICYAIDHFTPKARERVYVQNLNDEANGKKLHQMTYEEKMTRLDLLLAAEDIERESWQVMRSSYIKEHEVDVVKIENKRLLGYAEMIQKILKERGIDIIL